MGPAHYCLHSALRPHSTKFAHPYPNPVEIALGCLQVIPSPAFGKRGKKMWGPPFHCPEKTPSLQLLSDSTSPKKYLRPRLPISTADGFSHVPCFRISL
jgi:hypothetical protein